MSKFAQKMHKICIFIFQLLTQIAFKYFAVFEKYSKNLFYLNCAIYTLSSVINKIISIFFEMFSKVFKLYMKYIHT